MIDIEKQIAYWRIGAGEDWQAAKQLVNSRKTRHGLFFAHSAGKIAESTCLSADKTVGSADS